VPVGTPVSCCGGVEGESDASGDSGGTWFTYQCVMSTGGVFGGGTGGRGGIAGGDGPLGTGGASSFTVRYTTSPGAII
jgi:hypothetical protein